MSRYPAYSEYKDSGVAWLGEIPAEWKSTRIKFTTYVKGRVGWHGLNSTEFLYEGDYYLVTGTDFKNRSINWDTCYRITQDRYEEDPYIHLKEGDILITKDGTIGKVAQVKNIPYKASVNSGVFVTRPLENKVYDSDFMYFLLNSNVFLEFIENQKSGTTINHLYQNILENFEYPVPASLDEQRTIARFLDAKTVQIDALIAKKVALLAALAEQRTALISHAVTRGLDPAAPMKDSGVAWLGEIPAHWKAAKIKRLTAVKRGASPRPIDDPKYFDDEGEYAWVRIADVTASDRYLEETTQRLSQLGKSLSVPLESGDIFLSIAGSVGKPIITKIKCCIHDGFVYFPTLSGNREFLYYIFKTGKPYLGLGKLGTQLNLNTDTVGDIVIGLPPEQEQKAIVEYINHKVLHLDQQEGKIQQAIDALREYRTALITNAVTGKIDVRGVAVR